MRFCFDSRQFTDQHTDSGKLAVVGENGEITWAEFESRVANFCTFFKSKGWDKLEFPVILYGHKQVEMIVAVYGLMQLQVPYIPADVIYPKNRVESIKQISKTNLIINCSDEELDFSDVSILSFRNNTLEILQEAEMILAAEKPADPLVYLIFTSGSTGEPKGVQISTEAVRDFTQWMREDFGFQPHDVFINIAVLSFDLSVYELMSFGAIGATLLLNSKTVSENPDLLMDRIQKYQGSIWVSTPSFSFIYSRIDEVSRLESIRYFLFCGELLPHSLAKTLVEKFPKAIVYNTYGPTEATVATTMIRIDEAVLEKHPVLPVGKSKPRSRIVIDRDEIVIVGKNVSLGYLNRPDLNVEKFITIDDERAFKTGDQGYLEDDVLFFKGRNDDQVKLHGFRIELNEITSVLNDLSFVLQAETIPLKRNGEVKKIVSLVQLKSGLEEHTDWKAEILEGLNRKLPYYMIPSDFKFIDKMPLNQNGKADKKMLEQIYLAKS
ncbi:AMP-binding protein [Fluviicola sp.]|uniref:AMP-binding protein n=1 Tax=Fluviicola sp. TaxID=1917219 RepID=UPI0031DE68DB